MPDPRQGLGPLIGVARRRFNPMMLAGGAAIGALSCLLWWAGGRHGAHPGTQAASLVLGALGGILLGLHLTSRMKVHENGTEVAWGDEKVMLFSDLREIRQRSKGKLTEWVFVTKQGLYRTLDQSWLMSEAVRARIERECVRLGGVKRT